MLFLLILGFSALLTRWKSLVRIQRRPLDLRQNSTSFRHAICARPAIGRAKSEAIDGAIRSPTATALTLGNGQCGWDSNRDPHSQGPSLGSWLMSDPATVDPVIELAKGGTAVRWAPCWKGIART